MKPRANCYKIDRIEYKEPVIGLDMDWICIVVWCGLVMMVAAFWLWGVTR
jgi:hypothetical protein